VCLANLLLLIIMDVWPTPIKPIYSNANDDGADGIFFVIERVDRKWRENGVILLHFIHL
jgi:hypothetical protein